MSAPKTICIFFSCLNLVCAFSQDKSVTAKIDPIFPEYNKNLIFVEGEDTAATNFSKEPIVNYGCSGKRTLQLSRATGLQGNAPFYADFLFYAEIPGTYELWYGGTPPGPKDELAQSYSSPFGYSFDEGRKKSVYREDMVVVEEYSPSYYWNRVGDINLSEGQHKIRFEVTERRRYDGRFYFYLDCFFLIRKEGKNRIMGAFPEVFPKKMDDLSINYPFKPIDDYLIMIRDKPQDTGPLVEISMIYSLLSDYLNAIKYLKRANLLEPENMDIVLLIAKNYIWKGDVESGLEKYNELLNEAPDRIDVWLEAGKVAAWTGRYKESLAYYAEALTYFPDSVDLKVNMAITLLWNSAEKAAEKILNDVFESQKSDVALLVKLAGTLEVAGYPDKAIGIYIATQALFLRYIEPYILQTELFRKTGKFEEADRVDARIRQQFTESALLAQFLDIQKKKQTLKDWLVDEYRTKLKAQPDNLELRELLAQILFWQGKQKQAIDEYMNILTNHAYKYVKNMDSNALVLYEMIDKASVLYALFENMSRLAAEKKITIQNQYDKYKAVTNELNLVENNIARAKQQSEKLIQEIQAATDTNVKAQKQAELQRINESLVADEMKKSETMTKVDNERKLLVEFIGNGYIFIDQIREARKVLEAIKPQVDELDAKEKADQEKFSKQAAKSSWRYNKTDFLGELYTSEQSGLFLAKHLLAKMNQADRNYFASENLIKQSVETTPTLPPETKYLYFEDLLWQRKIDEALKFMNANLGPLSEFAYYTLSIRDLIVKLHGTRPYFGGVKDDYDAEISALFANIDKEASDAGAAARTIEDLLAGLQAGYSARLVRSIYLYYTDTALLRNELGRFYLKENNVKAAIRQFEIVLAMNVTDIDAKISAMYQLGIVYKLNDQWARAMDLFRQVYELDATYELAASYYNELAREHSDSVGILSNFTVEPKGIDFQTSFRYNHIFSEVVTLEIAYLLDYFRYMKTYDAAVEPYAFDVHDVGFALWMDLGFITIKPIVGVEFAYSDRYYNDAKAGAFPAPYFIDQFLAYFAAPQPYGGVEITTGKGTALSFVLDGGYERLFETYAYHLADWWTLWARGDLTLDLAPTRVPVVKGIKSNLFGKFQYLNDDNIMYDVGLTLDFKFIDIDEPLGIQVMIYGDALYQDSVYEQAVASEYYKPKEKLEVIGGVSGAFYIPLSTNQTLGLSLDVGVGPIWEYMFTDADRGTGLKYTVLFSIDYLFENSRLSLQGYFTATNFSEYKKNPADVGWTYFQTALRLGYSVNFPSLIVK